jgi:hypothetical protein
MKVKTLLWLGVKTPHFDAMTTLYRDVMGLDVFQADAASSTGVGLKTNERMF